MERPEMDAFLPDPTRLPPSPLARPRRRGIGPSLVLAAAFGLALAFGLLAAQVRAGHTAAFDRAVTVALRTGGASRGGDPAGLVGPPWLEEMARDVTALGSHAVVDFLLAAVLGYLLLVRKRATALLVAAAVLGGMALSALLKVGFHRPRPELVPHAARVFTASFPSGHATLSAVASITLAAVLARAEPDRRVRAYFVALAVSLTAAVGLSRVYLGLHHPSDVLAGWCLGGAWALLCWAVALWLRRRGRVERPGEAAG